MCPLQHLTEQVVSWQQTISLLKVKTWTWRSHLTEIRLSRCFTTVFQCALLINWQGEKQGTFVAYLFQFSSAVLRLGSLDVDANLQGHCKEAE